MKDSNQQALAMFHAYLDDQLSPSARAQFEQISEKNPGLQKRLAQQQSIRQQIRSRFLDTPVDTPTVARLQNFVLHYGDSASDAVAAGSKAFGNSKTSQQGSAMRSTSERNRNTSSLGNSQSKQAFEPLFDNDEQTPTGTQEIILEDRDEISWQQKMERFANYHIGSIAQSFKKSMRNQREFPDHNSPVADVAASAQPMWIKPALLALSLALVFALGLLLGGDESSRTPESSDSVLSAIELLALDAHRIYSSEKAHAVEMPAANVDQLMNWLSKRLGTQVGPVKLNSEGYQLMGGRLLPSMRKHAGMYMYHDSLDSRVSLIMRRYPDGRMPMKCRQQSELSACYWQKSKLLYFLIAQLPAEKLKPLARTAQRQLP